MTDEPKMIGTHNLTVVDYWKGKATKLETELAQSQAEVERLNRALAFISIRSGVQGEAETMNKERISNE